VTPEKLRQIISEGEKSDVEFKESFDREAVETKIQCQSTGRKSAESEDWKHG